MARARRPRAHRVLIVLLALALIVLLAWAFLFRVPSPVGHWRSAQGHDAFAAIYAQAMADLPVPDATLDIRTDYGIVRFYRFEGNLARAEPLVLLPGRASASPVWADNLPSLLEIGDVYTIDLLGEPGMSVQDRPIVDDADQALWLHRALGRLPERRFHVIGLSIGAWTAANLAMRQPAHVATLTLIDPVFVFDGMPLETVLRSIPASLPWLPQSWRDSFNSWTAGGAPVEDVPVARMIEAGMRHYALRLPQPSRIPEPALEDLTMPMLAIIAGRSVMHDPSEAIALAERTAQEVAVYPDASHAINGEYPREIAADIAGFLDQHE